MDYWDGRSSQRKTAPLKPTYPTDFHDDIGNAGGKIHDVAGALSTAFSSGDSKAATGEAIDAVLGASMHALIADDGVQLMGFGSFSTGQRAARNPSTGAEIQIAAARTVRPTNDLRTFTMSAIL